MQSGSNFSSNNIYKQDEFRLIETHEVHQEMQEIEIKEYQESEEIQEVQQYSYNSVIVQQDERETYENHLLEEQPREETYSAGTSRRAFYFANPPEQNHQDEVISVPNKVKLVAYPNMNFSLQNNEKYIIQEEVSLSSIYQGIKNLIK